MQEQSKSATIKHISTEREYGKKVYEAEMVYGHSENIQIEKDGTLNEIKEEVVFDSRCALPSITIVFRVPALTGIRSMTLC